MYVISEITILEDNILFFDEDNDFIKQNDKNFYSKKYLNTFIRKEGNRQVDLNPNPLYFQYYAICAFNEYIFNIKIYDVEDLPRGFGLWLYNVGQHEPLFKAVKLLLEQYHDLAERLTVLHEGRAKIIREYGKGSNVKALDSDIKKLSALGWELTKVTKRFFVAIKPRMVKLEVAATRQQALAGLRTFENEIDSAQTTSSQSLDDIIANIDQAVGKLERAINQ